MKAGIKCALRLFKKHLARLITITAIVLVSVSFMSGIGEVDGRIKVASDKYYKIHNMSDLYVKSSRATGFTQSELSYFDSFSEQYDLVKLFTYENKNEDTGVITRVYNYDLNASNVNKLEIIDGRLPEASDEVLFERATDDYKEYSVGDEVSVSLPMGGNQKFKISGICINPMLLLRTKERSFRYDGEYLGEVVYINSAPLTVNDLYIALPERSTFKNFSERYEAEVKESAESLERLFGVDGNGEPYMRVLTIFENEGFYAMDQYAEKVGQIGIIIVVFFLLVTLLVVYSTMSRLFDEERAQIACLKTLGYGNLSIIFKYLLFVLAGTVIGGLLASFGGIWLTYIIYCAFGIQYDMPPFPAASNFIYYFSTFGIIVLATLILTFAAGMSIVRHKPARLLTPKAPKTGKKVLMERIKPVWNRLSFKHKSTMRNVFLFKSRFLMTVVSVMGSSILVLAGMGLTDCVLKVGNAQSILAISIALIVFSAVLCALVIYNLTNINVSERTREIATLMVLGYSDREVSEYVYREVYVLSFIGAVLGLPFGFLFLDFVFKFINFGAVADMNWWTWLLSPLITMLFCFISTRLLYKKIIKTDMNASLKILE